MIETIKGHRNKFLKWKEAFESKGLKIDFFFRVNDQRWHHKRWHA